MGEDAVRTIEVGLVLQGGGALGAYEWGAVTALLDLMDAAKDAGHAVTLRGVTGVSIGAVNAACIVGAASFADASARLAALWADLRLVTPPFTPPSVARDLAFFGLPGFYEPRLDVWNALAWTSVYDTTPLLRTLRAHVDFEALNASDTAFVVTAVDVESGELVRFRNAGGRHPPPDAIDADKPVSDRPIPIGPEHILASGSLAPQFPWTEIGGRRYWDGGLVDNTPLGDVIDAFSDGPGTERIVVAMNLYPLRAPRPTTLAQVQDRVHELSFGNRLRQDRESAHRINAMVETLDALAGLTESAGLPIPQDLAEEVAKLRAYKRVLIREIDVQDRDGHPQAPEDHADGQRDFSAETVARRRDYGYALAHAQLVDLFCGPIRSLAAGRPRLIPSGADLDRWPRSARPADDRRPAVAGAAGDE